RAAAIRSRAAGSRATSSLPSATATAFTRYSRPAGEGRSASWTLRRPEGKELRDGPQAWHLVRAGQDRPEDPAQPLLPGPARVRVWLRQSQDAGGVPGGEGGGRLGWGVC